MKTNNQSHSFGGIQIRYTRWEVIELVSLQDWDMNPDLIIVSYIPLLWKKSKSLVSAFKSSKQINANKLTKSKSTFSGSRF